MLTQPNRTVVSTAILILMFALLTACAPPGPQTVAFVVEVWDPSYNPVPGHSMHINVMGLDKNGNPGRWLDPDTGEWQPYPLDKDVESPFSHPLTVLPGESTAVTLKATLHARVGSYVTCAVYVNGEVTEETDEQRIPFYEHIPPDSQVNMSGVVTAFCAYTLNVPLS